MNTAGLLLEFVPLINWHLGYMGVARPNVCEDTRGITAIKAGIPQAVCVFDNWSYNSCMIHIWIGNPFVLRHGFAEEVFKFAFSGDRTKIIGITPSDNLKALKFIKNIGFREIYRIRDGCEIGVDYVLTEMTKDKCRYLKDGKIISS